MIKKEKQWYLYTTESHVLFKNMRHKEHMACVISVLQIVGISLIICQMQTKEIGKVGCLQNK